QFQSATFSLVQRSARGAAKEMQLSPQGLIRLQRVTFTTCPVNDQSWVLRAARITLDTQKREGTGRNARIDFKGVPILYLPWVSFPLGNQRKSGFLFPHWATLRAAVWSSPFPTTSTSHRTWTSRSSRRNTPAADPMSAAISAISP